MAVARLFEAYAKFLGVDLCFQDFPEELAGLPGKYAAPVGELLLARGDSGDPLGCVALRPLEPGVCEMKRLYVAPRARGLGLGRALVDRVLGEALRIGYREMRLDTLPVLKAATALYAAAGFAPIAAYYDTPLAETLFLARAVALTPVAARLSPRYIPISEDAPMPSLVLLRHGQSQWNLENRFTGWVDVNLTAEGEAQARKGGDLIAAAGIAIDRAYTSVLTRAIRTCNLALTAAGLAWVPVTKDWRLNERHYGGLTGLDKAETAALHGDAQVKIWRRSYDVPPPPLAPGGAYDFTADRRYAGIDIPDTESLKTTLDRVAPYWDAEIAPRLKAGETLLIAAHGNSLRAIVKLLFAVPDDAIVGVEIPTGNPLLIDLDADLNPVAVRYLDEARAEKTPPLPAPAAA